MKLRFVALVATATTLVGPTGAAADGVFSNGQFNIGGGAVHTQHLYKGEEYETSFVPFLSYDSDRLHLGFDGIGYKVIRSDNLELALRLSPGQTPDFPEKNPLYAGLIRGTPVDAGFDISYQFEPFYVTGGVMMDVASEHSGYQAEVKVGSQFSLGALGVDIGAGARMRNGKLNNFLYGVSTAEANGLRSAYDVGATTEPFLDLTVSYSLSDNVSMIGIVDYHLMDDKVNDSPLTNGKDSLSVGLGVIYSF